MISAIKIETRLRANKNGISSFLNLNIETIEDIKRGALQILRRNAPARSFDLQRSIDVIEHTRKGGIENSETIIRLGPTAPHSKFVLRGVRPSKGRYVDIIGKRIRTGIHPGQKANPFVKNSRREINSMIRYIIRFKYGRVAIRKFVIGA